MADVVLRDVRKSFGDVEIIHGADLHIRHGEFVVFVGPSGCGKSTLLRLIAGLEEITSGELTINGRRCNDLPPSERGIAMVFQSYALYPHMDVYENMAFALKLARVKKPDIDRRVRKAAEILRITDKLREKPKALSGGQRQRVAIGRAIVREPEVFLFDEPLSNLDAALRVQMRIEIAKLHADLKTTIIYVTHDQIEAMTMADKIVVLEAGNIRQCGAPLELYNHPANLFVAGFIGSPRMNFLSGALVEPGRAPATDAADAGDAADATDAVVELPGGSRIRARVDTGEARAGDAVTLGIRPEHLIADGQGAGHRAGHRAGMTADQVAGQDADASSIPGEVVLVEHLGEQTLVYVKTAAGDELLVVRVDGISRIRAGQDIEVGVPAGACYLFDASGSAFRRVGVPDTAPSA